MKECTGCEKGLKYVAKIVIEGNEAKLSKLRLCKECRNNLLATVNEVIK